MKVTALIYLTVVMIITIGFVTTNSGTEVSNATLSCQPFSVQIIWHTGSGGNVSLLQHARLLVVLISDFPENTSVSLVTIGAKHFIRLHFRKQEGSTSWRDRILNYKPGISLNHVVSYADILKALSYHKRNSSKAQLVYLLVNRKTVIRDEENGFEKLRKLKTFVVLAEVKTASKAESWVKLASNEQHFVAWDSRNEDEINKTKNILLARSCQDSLFVCDTDMYWSSDRNRCYACANICLSSCKRQPEYCVHACPFFYQSLLGNDVSTGDGLNNELSSQKQTPSVEFNFSWLIIFIVFITIVVAFKKRKKIPRYLSSAKNSKAFYHQAEQNNYLHYKKYSNDESSGPLHIPGNPTSSSGIGGKSMSCSF